MLVVARYLHRGLPNQENPMLVFIPPLLNFLHDLLKAISGPEGAWPDRSAYLLMHGPR